MAMRRDENAGRSLLNFDRKMETPRQYYHPYMPCTALPGFGCSISRPKYKSLPCVNYLHMPLQSSNPGFVALSQDLVNHSGLKWQRCSFGRCTRCGFV